MVLEHTTSERSGVERIFGTSLLRQVLAWQPAIAHVCRETGFPCKWHKAGPSNPCGVRTAFSAVFSFGSSSNWEVLAKVLNGCGINGQASGVTTFPPAHPRSDLESAEGDQSVGFASAIQPDDTLLKSEQALQPDPEGVPTLARGERQYLQWFAAI